MTTLSSFVLEPALPGFEPAFKPDAWIQTFTGRQFWPLNPRPEDVDLLDIAHALAMKCRYSGHTKRFYSVAEHSVHVSRHVPAEHALAALLHDAGEAYLPDVPRPIKPQMPGFKQIEERIDRAIATRFGCAFPWPESVHRADIAILADEKAALMGPEPAPWHLPYPPLGVKIECWDPEEAKWRFAVRFFNIQRGL